ncbi:bacillithiol biosynthesis deacetylase BshB2 [Paenibacillus protaetiae]|uniref:Bacillithiol biosynthesis deacetylase BshB2 n=1 Tax=Paenibacillus protaetiae TaxID=2509456 RepID=A0A4P6EX53_9BACL|nr:bacillithiol biosynthesis deacetylase BshB2 [Paenibacillus protaetiae]QAY67225.1 bacillithiol biosynthesis deacetylase BshB2 [Paenibacillus protaetiae]
MERILVVLPHPDDECFGLSGTLASHIHDGAEVTYACLTLGQMARNMGSPPFANRITLPEIRTRELEQSCHAIGIQHLKLLGFHDKMIEFEDQALLDGRIREVIDEVQPQIIYTFFPGFAVHPDHDATGAAVVRVVGGMAPGERPLVRAMAFAAGHEQAIGAPDVQVDVKRYIEHKLASVRSHSSQFHMHAAFNSQSDAEEIVSRLGTERFWTYRFA